MRILIVEDERRLAGTLHDILTGNNYLSDVSYDGESGLDNALSGIYDAVILDVMLPKMDGFEVVRAMRREGCSTPVLLLTARSAVSDKITGLDCGADYYLTKPFDTNELLACLRSLLRRQGEVTGEELTFGDLTLNLSTCCISCGERDIRLSAREFELMQLLIRNGENNISKETLLIKVWGYDSEAEDNHVEVYISFLRKKLALIKSHVTIGTTRRIGYHLEVKSDD